MAGIGKESRLQVFEMISIMILYGVIIGAMGSYFFYNQVIGRIHDRVDSIKQQITPAAHTPEMKPTEGKVSKKKKAIERFLPFGSPDHPLRVMMAAPNLMKGIV